MSRYYAADLAALQSATARLLWAGPPQQPGGDPLAVLVARDTVVASIRATVHTLTHPNPRIGTGDASPLPALAAALDQLHHGRPAPLSPADAVTRLGGEPLWAAAARAAVTLEHHHDQLRALPDGDQTHAVAAGLAHLARAVPYLDADLAARHPGLGARLEHLRADHARLTAAASAVIAAADPQTPAVVHPALPAATPPRPLRVTAPEHIPEGLRRLAAILNAAPTLANRDIHVVIHIVAATAAATGRGLTALPTGDDPTPGIGECAALIDRARDLPRHHRFVATIAPPSPALTLQAQALTAAIRTMPTAARAVLDVADELPRLTTALHAAITRTAAAGAFLAPNLTELPRRSNTLWNREPDTTHPFLSRLLTDAGRLEQTGADLAIPMLAARAVLDAPTAAQRAVRDARLTAAGLHDALTHRTGTPLAYVDRVRSQRDGIAARDAGRCHGK